MEEWMSSVSTDPDIQDAILHHLKGWRTNSMNTPYDLRDLNAKSAGSAYVLGGLDTSGVGGGTTQQAYYSLLKSHRMG
jgi:hypothetical protein